MTLGRLADDALRPRAVLTEIVSDVVASAEQVTAGRFPQSTAWRKAADEAVSARRLPEMPFAWLSRLEEVTDDEERARVRLVLRAWPEPDDSVDPLLRELGFGVTIDDVAEAPRPKGKKAQKPAPETETLTAQGSSSRPRDEEQWVQEVQRWGGGAVRLTQHPAREARNLVWNAVDSGIRWYELGENPPAVKKLLGLTGMQVQNIAVDLKGTEAGRALSASGNSLVTLEATAANAATLIALFDQSRGRQLRLEDLARIENLIEDAESAVRAALAKGPGSVTHLTGLAKLLAVSALPLSRRLNALERPEFNTAMTLIDGAEVVGPRAIAWLRAVKLAEDHHRRAVERLTAAATRTQGRGGAPTAMDHAAIDRKSLRNDPYGLRVMTGSADDVQHHREFVESLREASEAEGERLRQDLEVIASHSGAENSLRWQTMIVAAEEAMAAAARRGVLRPENLLAQIRDYEVPSPEEAAEAVNDAWVAVRAANKDNLPEAVYRLAVVDTGMVTAIREHLDRISRVLRESSDSAEAALNAKALTGHAAGDEIRAIAAELLARVRSMLP